MPESRTRAVAGAAILLFLVAAIAPYSYLVAAFGYDDVLREPAGTVLTKFSAGGPALIVAWLAFSLAALGFSLVALALSRWLAARTGDPLSAATAFGLISSVLQAVGLARWVFVVPPLAAAYVDPATTEGKRETIVLLFGAIHQYGGVAIGEHLGQLTLVPWTAGVGLALLRLPGLWKGLGAPPLATIPLWLLGQTELLRGVMPATPLIETTPIAFILWEVWLLALGLALLAGAIRPRESASSQPAAT